MKQKEPFEDDGRTIADMSGVTRRPLLLFRTPEREESRQEQPESDQKPPELSKEEQRSFMAGALGAALLIGSIFIVAGGLFIWFLTAVLWHS